MPEGNVLPDADTLLEELESLRERRDEVFELIVDSLRDAEQAIVEIRSEVEDQLAESDFTVAQDTVARAISVINTAVNDPQLEELCRLAEIRLPGDTEPALVENPDLSAFHRIIDPELPSPTDKLGDQVDEEDARIRALLDGRDTCARRIGALLEHFSWDLWPATVKYACEGNVTALKATLVACEALAVDLREAYDLWVLWLNELFVNDPAHLGTVGESVHAALAWLVNHHRPSVD